MAGGWAKDGAEQEQMESTRSQLPRGESLETCEECGDPIPEPRRKAIPGVRLCVVCQGELDKKQSAFSGYNRRGSKDSQLR